MKNTISVEQKVLSDSLSSNPKAAGATAGGVRNRLASSIITLEDIRVRAYSIWQAAGCPDGDSSRFWLEAEQELLKGR